MVADDMAPEVGDRPSTETVEPTRVVDETLIVEDEDLGPRQGGLGTVAGTVEDGDLLG